MGRRPDLIRALVVVFVLGLAVTGVSSIWHARQQQEQAKATQPVRHDHQRQVLAGVFQNGYPRD